MNEAQSTTPEVGSSLGQATTKEARLGDVALDKTLRVSGEVARSGLGIVGLDEHGQPVTENDQKLELAYRQVHGRSSDETATRI